MSDMSVGMMKSVVQMEWDKFEKDVVPSDADIVQRSEMRLAFISGMVVGLSKYRTIHHVGKDNFAKAVAKEAEKYITKQAKEIYEESKI